MIERTIEKHILESVSQWPVTLITGARQVGKSTLCKSIMNKLDFEYISLDDRKERTLAIRDPEMFLKTHKSPLIIEDVQYAPELFEEIEHIVNKQKFETGNNYVMYILTGSHAYKLMDNVTESLAGRINIVEMSPLFIPQYRCIIRSTNSLNRLYFKILNLLNPTSSPQPLAHNSRQQTNFT